MTPATFDKLHSLVDDKLKHHATAMCPVSTAERLYITLRGSSQQDLSFDFRVGKSTICGIIEETLDAIWSCLSDTYLAVPDEVTWKAIARDFEQKWNFLHCCGAIDGKHIILQLPASGGSEFYNYKGLYSVVLLAVCDTDYNFLLVDIGQPGRSSDGGTYANSKFGKDLESGALRLPASNEVGCFGHLPYVFVADEAFPLKAYMMRPYPGKYLPEDKAVFNYRLSRARRVVENAFGILVARWRILRSPIIASVGKVNKIIKAVVCLHNFCKAADGQLSYCPPGYVDTEDDFGNLRPGDWREEIGHNDGVRDLGRVGSNTYNCTAAQARDRFKNYFMADGAVPWQLQSIHRGRWAQR